MSMCGYSNYPNLIVTWLVDRSSAGMSFSAMRI